MIASLKTASQIKVGRSFQDFYSDRLKQAVTENSLLSMAERLGNMTNVSQAYVSKDTMTAFVKSATQPEAAAVLSWLRKYIRLVSMIVFLKTPEERAAVLEDIQIESDMGTDPGRAVKRNPFDVNMSVICTTPLAHGGDTKAGNATLYRRMDVMSDTGQILTLPYYAGNALRGQVRDLLADHFLESVGHAPRRDVPPVAMWFFHSLYSGGALSEKNKETAAITKISGGHAVKAEGIKKIRDMLPALSSLGFAFGNRIISGRCEFGDLRPLCYQWGNHDYLSANELIEWIFLTRREDHEGHGDDENSSMIANCECLKAGTQLEGGINISHLASDIERSAIAKGLQLLQANGRIGAENRRDCGGVRIEYTGLPDTGIYEKYLADNRQSVIDFLNSINAFAGDMLVSPEGEQIAVTPESDDVVF